MLAYMMYPDWIKPEVFSFLDLPSFLSFLNVVRWYGLMYIIGLVLFNYQANYLLKHDNFKTINKKVFDDLLFVGIIGLILGGRIFSCIVYDFYYYIYHPLEILIPFRNGQFVGFSGMSYHGAVLGIIIALAIASKVKKINPHEIVDLVFPAAPLGYTFGRLGNFINAELYGRITASPIGMLFPNKTTEFLPTTLPEVQKVITKLGWKINESAGEVYNKAGELVEGAYINGMINLPRHPSQLYEAFFEGIVLFLIMWFPARKYKPFKGSMGAIYMGGYAIARFFIEFFRQPDKQFADGDPDKYIGFVAGQLSMGQILSIFMLIFAIGFGVFFYYYKPQESAEIEKNNNTTNKNKERRKRKKK